LERLDADYKDQQERNHKNRQEISRLLDMRNARDADIQSYSVRISNMKRDLDDHSNRINHLQSVHEEKSETSAKLSNTIATASQEAKGQTYDMQQLDKELMYQEQNNEKLRQQQTDL
jgi:hypothetical protein